jgi:hypothetical protein
VAIEVVLVSMSEPIEIQQPDALLAGPKGRPLRHVPEVPGAVKWHVLTIIAGGILLATFFLPLDSLANRGTHDKPAYILWEFLRHADDLPAVLGSPRALGKLTFRFTLTILPHLWGLLLTLMSIMSMLGWRRLRVVPQSAGVLLGVLVVSAWLTFAAGPIIAFLGSPGRGLSSMPSLDIVLGVTSVVGVVGVLYTLLAICRPNWACLYHGFAGAGAMLFALLVLHAFILIGGGPGGRYPGLTGLMITTLAWCLLFVSRVGEARAVTGLSWPRTLWYLLTLRLHKAPILAGLCPGCGYNLYGLREQRCPECGRRFSFEEIFSTPQSLGFAGSLPEADNPTSP